jgi:hypothetical protein
MAAEDRCAICGLRRREHRSSGAAYRRCDAFVERPEDGAWMIVFEDRDEAREVFTGHGAEEAARKRFDQLKGNWSIHLFQRVASA